MARSLEAHAATDVSGFGLGGHLGELLAASRASARVSLDALPLLPGVETLLSAGVRSTYHAQNVEQTSGVGVDPAAARDVRQEILFDPQTSGGLVLALPAERGEEAIARLHEAGDADAAIVGHVLPEGAGPRLQVTP